MEWNTILDIALVAIIVLTLLINTKRGFFKTLLKAVRTIAVIVLAALLTPMLAGFVSDTFVDGMFDGKITEVVVQGIDPEQFNIEIDIPTAIKDGGGIDELLPEGVELPMDVETVIGMIDPDGAIMSYKGTVGGFATMIGGRLEAFATLMVAHVIAYLALALIFFIILTIIISFLSKKLKGITVLNKIDHVLGFVWGLIVSYFWVSLITFVAPLVQPGIMDGTVVAGFLSEISVFTLVLEPILAELMSGLPL